MVFHRAIKSNWRKVLTERKQQSLGSKCPSIPKDKFPQSSKFCDNYHLLWQNNGWRDHGTIVFFSFLSLTTNAIKLTKKKISKNVPPGTSIGWLEILGVSKEANHVQVLTNSVLTKVPQRENTSGKTVKLRFYFKFGRQFCTISIHVNERIWSGISDLISSGKVAQRHRTKLWSVQWKWQVVTIGSGPPT